MAELRWVLLVIGVIALVAIYIFTRYKPRLPMGRGRSGARREPVIGEAGVAPQGDSPDPTDSDAADRIAEKIITVRLVARIAEGIPGEQLILALREAGLKHGRFGAFHRCEGDDESNVWYSVVSLIEPGTFDLKRIKSDRYPGISLFLVLPGIVDGVVAFDDMLSTARSLAATLDGELLDEEGSTLSVQRERYLREEIIQIEHQGYTASS